LILTYLCIFLKELFLHSEWILFKVEVLSLILILYLSI
jgi:hypothetical protein